MVLFYMRLNSFNKVEDSKKQTPERYGFTSLSIMDIENGIVQHVFVFFENIRTKVTCDVLKENKRLSLALTEVSHR